MINRATILKTLKFSLPALSVILIVGLIVAYYDHYSSNNENNHKNISRYPFPKSRHIINGLHFDGWHEGKKVITIEADRFSTEKKKLGFFRFGLMNVARFENAYIHIFGKGLLNRHETDKPQQDLTFKDIFSKEALPALPVKKVSSVEIEPVCVELHDEKSVAMKITADFASIRLRKRDIFFTGNVRVESGPNSLTTDTLSFNPDTAVIKTNDHFILKSPEKQEKGNRLKADLFLRQIIN